jgi:hypothetical protein
MPEIDRNEMDKSIFDVVMSYLYLNADKNAIDLDKDILSRMTIKLPEREKDRVWDVLTTSGWISPVVGFGNAGKVELTQAGIQLMSQFGSYSNYLAAAHNNPTHGAIVRSVSENETNETEGQNASAAKEQKKK